MNLVERGQGRVAVNTSNPTNQDPITTYIASGKKLVSNVKEMGRINNELKDLKSQEVNLKERINLLDKDINTAENEKKAIQQENEKLKAGLVAKNNNLQNIQSQRKDNQAERAANQKQIEMLRALQEKRKQEALLKQQQQVVTKG